MSGFFQHGVRVGRFAVVLAVIFAVTTSGTAFAVCGTAPTVSFDQAAKEVLPGGSIDYTVTITNNAGGSCDFDLSTSGDSAGFTSSLPDGTPFTVAGSSSDTTTLRVSAIAGQAIASVNVTTLSVDAIDTDATTTVNNPMMHNSFNLGSSKWAAQGGWGIVGGQYGEFSCNTCHAKNTGNIKRVVSTLPSAPDTGNGDFPGAGQTVTFLRTSGADSFGDDSSTHATSTRICEVCHTYDVTVPIEGVKFHAYNMGVTAGHENNNDCLNCHQHKTGFRASCTSCHGDEGSGKIWPDGIDNNGGRVAYADDQAGAHDNHVVAISQELFGMDEATLLSQADSSDRQITICAFCHPNPGGGGHDADGGADSLVDMQPAGSFEMFTVGAANHAADTTSGAYNFTNDSCSNLVCHNQIATPSGANDWNNPPASVDCTLCHTANGGTQRHDTHVGGSGQACTECHVDNGTFSGGTVGVSHGNGDVELKWDNAGSYEASFGDSSVTYSGTAEYKDASWGTCSSVACHSNSLTPAWDSTGAGCSLCHSGTETTGAHEFHMKLDGGDFYAETGYNSTTTQYDFGCADCHAGDSHVNGSTTVTTHGFNGGTKSCSTADCHSHKDHDGATTIYVPTPAWDTGSFAGDRCAGCHSNSPISAGHEEHQIGFHYDAVYSGFKDFMPNLPADTPVIGLVPGPADSGDGDSFNDSNDPLLGHGGKQGGTVTSTTMSCYVCHNDTVTDKWNDLDPVCATCHNDTDAPLMGTLTIADKSVHVNGVRDVVFMREKVRSKAQVRDELMDVPELSINWTRMNGYKQPDGSSYDESPTTLYDYVGGNGTYNATTMYGYNAATMTCQISCHLWEDGRVDKYPIGWYENSRHNPDTSKHIMCIDCHTRLPK